MEPRVRYGCRYGPPKVFDWIERPSRRASDCARLVADASARYRDIFRIGRIRKCADRRAAISDLLHEPEWNLTLSSSAALESRRSGLSRGNKYGRVVKRPSRDQFVDCDGFGVRSARARTRIRSTLRPTT